MPHRTTFADVLRVREYRALWTAQALSLVGDQLAVVALTWLVFEASGSPLLAALTFSIGFLPWIVGGPLLSGLADRYPRREVMVVCDLGRALLVLLIALPLPLWTACLLLAAAELMAPPFWAARSALLPDVLEGERYILGSAITNVTNQLGQVVGYAVGGLLVSLLQPRTALVVDAASFLLSAAVLRWGLTARPAARGAGERAPDDRAGGGRWAAALKDLMDGVRLIRREPRLRWLVGLALLCVFPVTAEGLAVPYAAQVGGGPTAAGVLLAAGPAGAVLGALLISRFVAPSRRSGLMLPLAVLSSAPLIAFAVVPGVAVAVLLLVVSGVASAYQVTANAEFVLTVPADARGQAFGLVQGAMSVGQGIAVVAAGAAASVMSPSTVVTLAGLFGCAAASYLVTLARGRQHPVNA